MPTFKRGDRVRHVKQRSSPLSEKKGTITHFHGEPGYNKNQTEVWVQLDEDKPQWVPITLLVKIS